MKAAKPFYCKKLSPKHPAGQYYAMCSVSTRIAQLRGSIFSNEAAFVFQKADKSPDPDGHPPPNPDNDKIAHHFEAAIMSVRVI
jgi:hypothetical protein